MDLDVPPLYWSVVVFSFFAIALYTELLVCKSFLDFRDILHPDTVSDVDHDFTRTLNYFDFFRRAVHVQSFQSPCTCTARPVLPSDFTPFDRANQELQNAFLDESLAQKEPKLWPCKVGTLFTILVFCMPI